jgi:hypothetical protein
MTRAQAKVWLAAQEGLVSKRDANYAMDMMMEGTLEHFWEKHAEWSQATFGSDETRGPIGALKHLQKEAGEALEHIDDLEEYADCMLLILDATRRAKFTYEQLIEAMWLKLGKNKQRMWPEPKPDEPVEHTK